MLSVQRKEFEGKKKEESPYPRDFARWGALDYFRRPRLLRSRRFYVTLTATLIFTILSGATLAPALHRTHQAASVSHAHAMLNQNCANCHDQMFQPLCRLFGCDHPSVTDAKCNSCHVGAPHHGKEPSCASCHAEHRGHENLASHVADRNCVACHRDLTEGQLLLTRAVFSTNITNFNSDHPEFKWSMKGQRDPSKVNFNHKAHLDLDLDALPPIARNGTTAKIQCADCHQLDDERKYMKPIAYENHCARCHQLNAPLIGDFAAGIKDAAGRFSRTPLPHKEPAIVRGVLRDRLVEFAQKHNIVGKAKTEQPRPLPWRPVTEEQWAWASDQTKKVEAVLFMNKQWKKTEPLTTCSHCHIEKPGRAEPRQGPGEMDRLPTFEKTMIPSRWHTHSVFSHGSHRSMKCEDCHDRNAAGIRVANSQSAADILLPTIKSCQECHTGNGGARNACVECHRYHQR